MSYKVLIKYFFIWTVALLFMVLTLNLSVDPYNKYGINLFSIKYKLTRDDRGFKIGQINNVEKIDNLIIGSSRSQTLDPKLLSDFLGGISYNFGVGGGKMEDALGLLYYLEKEKKLPKNILLAVDFSGFNSNSKMHSDFLNSKELNFLKRSMQEFEIAHFLSIDTTRSSFKTLRMHYKKQKPEVFFNENGLLVGDEKDINFLEMKKLSENYFEIAYSNGQFNIDTQRVDFFKQFVQLCKKYNISLKILMTPVFSYQLTLLQSHNELKVKYLELLQILASIYPLYNFMQDNQYTQNIDLFMDNVHFKRSFGNVMLLNIYSNQNDLFRLN